MAIRQMVYLGDKGLVAPSSPITEFGDRLQGILTDALETMYHADGIGIALPQLGLNLQGFWVDVTRDRSQPLCFINPEITWYSNHKVALTEGCLSIPGAYAEVMRPAKITVKALDRSGQPFERVVIGGLLARCIQHEYDHLSGKLFIQHLSPQQEAEAIRKHRAYLKARPRKLVVE